ncbi:hypothetical protein [Micromonospora sp. LOL_023]|uniref:hypothetical protein n=1 Tax=Micromonospora sp. LOL_023 TaxID=3345418 RepID=UPI003A84F217
MDFPRFSDCPRLPEPAALPRPSYDSYWERSRIEIGYDLEYLANDTSYDVPDEARPDDDGPDEDPELADRSDEGDTITDDDGPPDQDDDILDVGLEESEGSDPGVSQTARGRSNVSGDLESSDRSHERDANVANRPPEQEDGTGDITDNGHADGARETARLPDGGHSDRPQESAAEILRRMAQFLVGQPYFVT